MAEQFLVHSPDPVIDGAGSAEFDQNYYCIWNTTDGSTSICTITNPGTANTLTFVVSGAPSSITCTDGTPFNGQHVLLPNNPTHNVTAVGDFRGTQVTIFNMSALPATCDVKVQVS